MGSIPGKGTKIPHVVLCHQKIKKKRVQSCGTHEVHLEVFSASCSLFIHTAGGGRDVVQKDLPDDYNTHISYLPDTKKKCAFKSCTFPSLSWGGLQPVEFAACWRTLKTCKAAQWVGGGVETDFFSYCASLHGSRGRKTPFFECCSPSLKARKPYTRKLKSHEPGISMFLRTLCWGNWQTHREEKGE